MASRAKDRRIRLIQFAVESRGVRERNIIEVQYSSSLLMWEQLQFIGKGWSLTRVLFSFLSLPRRLMG